MIPALIALPACWFLAFVTSRAGEKEKVVRRSRNFPLGNRVFTHWITRCQTFLANLAINVAMLRAVKPPAALALPTGLFLANMANHGS